MNSFEKQYKKAFIPNFFLYSKILISNASGKKFQSKPMNEQKAKQKGLITEYKLVFKNTLH